MAEVDRVIGNDEKMRPDAWGDTRAFLARGAFGIGAEEKIAVNDIMAVKETAAHLIDGLDGRARAFVQVQNGCDHRCTFCIIPYGRGNSRSVPMGEVVAQIRRLVDNGYREVVLTGVDLTSYGGNLPGAPRLGTLVKQILKHVAASSSGCASPRSTRSRPTATCSTRFANDARLMPHLHLSLQHGDDLILKRMKRRHSRADAIAFCDQVRAPAPRRGVRRRHHRGLSDRDRGRCSRARSTSSTTAGSRICTCFRSRRGPARRRRACRRSRREIVKERARRLRAEGRGGARAPSRRRRSATTAARARRDRATAAAPSISRRCASARRSSPA